jgi:hypothetical protein
MLAIRATPLIASLFRGTRWPEFVIAISTKSQTAHASRAWRGDLLLGKAKRGAAQIGCQFDFAQL